MSEYNPIVELGLDHALEGDSSAEIKYLDTKISKLVRNHLRRDKFTEAGLLSLIVVVAIQILQRRTRNTHRHAAALIEQQLSDGVKGSNGPDGSLDYRISTVSIPRLCRGILTE